MTRQTFIGVAGTGHGIGKTSLAVDIASDIVRRFKGRKTVTVMSFADPLKKMLGTILDERYRDCAYKSIMPQELGGSVTIRYALQTLGTEWGRNLISKDLWVRALERNAERSDSDYIVIDDVRFINEAEAVKRHNGIMVFINVPVAEKETHSSEGEIKPETCGYVIDANRDTVYSDTKPYRELLDEIVRKAK